MKYHLIIRFSLLIGLFGSLAACQQEVDPINETTPSISAAQANRSGCNNKNCVLYVTTCKGVTLPWPPSNCGYFSYETKTAMINQSIPISSPRVGDIAIIDTDFEDKDCNGDTVKTGHMAYVEGINPLTGKVTISEGGWDANNNGVLGFNIRTDLPANMSIVGYIRP